MGKIMLREYTCVGERISDWMHFLVSLCCVLQCCQRCRWFTDAEADSTRLQGQMWKGTKQTPVSGRRWHHACFTSCYCPKSTVKLRSDYWYRQSPQAKKKKSLYSPILLELIGCRLHTTQSLLRKEGKSITFSIVFFPFLSWSLLCYSRLFFSFCLCLVAHTAHSSCLNNWYRTDYEGVEFTPYSYHGYTLILFRFLI